MSSEMDKMRYSFYSAIVFFIIASPLMFKIVNSLLGGLIPISSTSGCPTIAGLVIHSIVFGLIIYGMMHLKM
jgi:hypothetical protein